MKRPIILLLMLILVIYTPYLNYKYNQFYKEIPEEINIEAIIISDTKKSEYYNSYIIKGKNDIFRNKKFIVYTKNNLNFGDKVKITGTFNEPREQRNYKGFNYKKYLQTNKIYGTIKAKDIKIISKDSVNILLTFSHRLRNKIINNIKKILPEETEGLLIGIMLGDKTNLEDETISNFQKSNLSHVLAVSGAHISYIILGVTFFISFNKLPKKGGYLLTIFVLILFLFLTNFSISVIRACVMAIILIIAKLMYRKADIINTIGIALLITLINNPYTIRSVSMQLSYLGAAGVIFLSPIIEVQIQKLKINTKISKILSVPIAAHIAITPITIINFHTISYTFLISNIIAMPLLGMSIILGLIIVPISFVWMWGAQKLGIIIHLILKIIILIARLCSSIKLSNIYVVTPNIITIFIYYFILLTIIYISNLKKTQNLKQNEKEILRLISKIPIKKTIVIILIIVCLVEFPYINFNGKLKIYFIDVGQRR